MPDNPIEIVYLRLGETIKRFVDDQVDPIVDVPISKALKMFAPKAYARGIRHMVLERNEHEYIGEDGDLDATSYSVRIVFPGTDEPEYTIGMLYAPASMDEDSYDKQYKIALKAADAIKELFEDAGISVKDKKAGFAEHMREIWHEDDIEYGE